MPRVLEDAVLEIHASLAVVGARDDVNGAVHAAGVVLELGQINRGQVAEGAVAQQDFRAGVHTGKPRRAVQRGRAVDEARLGTAAGEHQIKNTTQLRARRFLVEDEGVVGHSALRLAFAPVIFFAHCEFLPFRRAIFKQANFRRAARAENGAQPVADVVDVHLAQELAGAAIHDFNDGAVSHGDGFIALPNPAVAGQPRAGGADFGKIESKFFGGIFAGQEFADGFGPRFGGVAHADGPFLGFGIPSFQVGLAPVFILPRGADDLHIENWLGEAADAAGLGRDAHAAALQQQPKCIHHVVHGLDFQMCAIELAGLAHFGDFRAAEPQRAAGHANLARQQQAAEFFQLGLLRFIQRSAQLAFP